MKNRTFCEWLRHLNNPFKTREQLEAVYLPMRINYGNEINVCGDCHSSSKFCNCYIIAQQKINQILNQ